MVTLSLYLFVLLDINQIRVVLDLFFLEFEMQLGILIISSFLLGLISAILFEIIYFSFKRKNKSE